eukprot:scaffold87201_cov45-Phaeocystis_antarctica.AAC.2
MQTPDLILESLIKQLKTTVLHLGPLAKARGRQGTSVYDCLGLHYSKTKGEPVTWNGHTASALIAPATHLRWF